MKKKDYPGRFIVVEGADGAGTTTQSRRLADEIDAYWTNEPSDNPVGEKIDDLISSERYDPETVALNFAADRMIHLEEEVIPRLKDGQTVVCDRYYHSSLVYQPVMGADREWVEQLNRDALKPDVTVVLDVSAEVGRERIDERGEDGNIFEDLSFQEKVVSRYREMKNLDENVQVIDGTGTKDEVFRSLRKAIKH